MDEYAHVYEESSSNGGAKRAPRGPRLPEWIPEPPAIVKRIHNDALERVVAPAVMALRFALVTAEEKVRETETKLKDWRYPDE